jgi:hypothetical protein
MKAFGFYHKDTGVLHDTQIMVSDDAMVALNTPTDHVPIEGQFDSLSQRIDIASGVVIDYQPPRPSPDREWNAESKRWQLNATAQAKVDARTQSLAHIAHLEAAQHRAIREAALGQPDAIARLQAIDAEIVSLRPALI